MSTMSEQSRSLREAISANRAALSDVLTRYGASNPRLFGSVAHGEARADSDVDVLVDLEPGRGNALLRVAGIGEEFSRVLGVRVDVAAESLLREPLSATAQRDAVTV